MAEKREGWLKREKGDLEERRVTEKREGWLKREKSG